MRFLVGANLPRSILTLLGNCGHSAEHVRDPGLGGAPDIQIAARARSNHEVLLTRDLDFADIRQYPPSEYPGLVVIRLPDEAVAQDLVNLMERFLKRDELLRHLPGHLVILERERVRFRPPLP